MESKRKVETYLIQYFCSICQDNMERVEGIMMLTYPPKFLYRCKNGHEQSLDKMYPCVEYV